MFKNDNYFNEIKLIFVTQKSALPIYGEQKLFMKPYPSNLLFHGFRDGMTLLFIFVNILIFLTGGYLEAAGIINSFWKFWNYISWFGVGYFTSSFAVVQVQYGEFNNISVLCKIWHKEITIAKNTHRFKSFICNGGQIWG